VTAALVTATVAVGAQGSIFTLRLLVQPRWVAAIIVANAAVAVVRLWAALDAYAVGRRAVARPSAPVMVLAVAALGAVLVVPHVVVGSKAAALLDLLDTVFVAEDPHVRFPERHAPATTGDTPIVASSRTSPSGPLLLDSPDGVPRPVRPSWASLPPPMSPPLDDERITLLLVGGDAGPGRSGLRTDAMVIATVDLSTGRAALISVSRELTGFPLPPAVADGRAVVDRQDLLRRLALAAEERGDTRATRAVPPEIDPCCWLDRINALYPFTRGLGWAYPGAVDPGLEALRESLEVGLALRIDYYVMVDMAGFEDVVDAVGGIRVTSRESMHVRFSPAREGDDWTVIDIEPGVHHFDGRTALAYMRNRTGSSDVDRTRRQRCLIREVGGRLDAGTVLLRFEAISRALQRHTTTNIPLRILPGLVTAVGELDRSDIGTVAIEPGPLATERDYRGLPVVDLVEARAAVRRLLDGLEGHGEPVTADECG
jgi:polyisoprenyl-teichoic acid--peptidoglycan teichoic acid transferase